MPAQRHSHLIVAIEILKSLGLPEKQQTDLCGNVLLALCSLKPDSSWSQITNEWIRIHDIIQFLKENYGIYYAENSRETIRKQALHNFRTAAIIEDNGLATNSPNYRYRLTEECRFLLQNKESPEWAEKLEAFKGSHQTLIQIYTSNVNRRKMPVKINSLDFSFSPGKHNQLQKAILEEFAPRFAPGSECLYVGDTRLKNLYINEQKLQQLGFLISVHDKMPDVVLYQEDKNWLFFIEAVTSVGPMDPKRILEINELTQNVSAGKIYITAFPDIETYKSFLSALAWETEVWIANTPEHLIHLNGDKFFGPRH